MMNWINKKRNKKGFTLIELVVVIAILGILAAIAIPRFSNVTQSAENRATQANHRILVSAISMYQAANNGALPTAAALTAEGGIDAVLGGYFEGDISEFEPTGSSYTFAAGTDPVKLVLTSKARDTSTTEATGLYTQSWE